MQVQYPNVLTLVIMLLAAWLTVSTWMSGNSFAVITLLSQGLVGVTTAFISGGVFVMSAWLPSHYVQASSHNSLSRFPEPICTSYFPQPLESLPHTLKKVAFRWTPATDNLTRI